MSTRSVEASSGASGDSQCPGPRAGARAAARSSCECRYRTERGWLSAPLRRTLVTVGVGDGVVSGSHAAATDVDHRVTRSSRYVVAEAVRQRSMKSTVSARAAAQVASGSMAAAAAATAAAGRGRLSSEKGPPSVHW